MIKMTAEKIAGAAMVGVAKVRKDIVKEKLNADSLVDILRYVQAYRMLAGGLKVWDGVMEKAVEKRVEVPTAFPDEGVEDLPRGVGFPRTTTDGGAGMSVKGFTPSYDDGQSDEEWHEPA